MSETDNAIKIPVPGNSGATYGPVPREDQLLQVHFLEIAPSPILADQIIFVYLRGDIPPSKKNPRHIDESLADAILEITLDVVLPDGRNEGATTYTIPLRTATYGVGGAAHVSIRDETGSYVDHLSVSGRCDILTDSVIPGMFLKTGTWTFEVSAKLPDGSCLFAYSLTQWLEGGIR